MLENKVIHSKDLLKASKPLTVDMAYNEVTSPDHSGEKHKIYFGSRSIDDRTRVRLVADHLALEVHVTKKEYDFNVVKDDNGYVLPGATFSRLLLRVADGYGGLHSVLGDAAFIIAERSLQEGRRQLATDLRVLIGIRP